MKTSSFRLYTGPGRISIARWAPRGCPAGYRVFTPLAPGKWFNSVADDEYIALYMKQLAALDPQKTWDQLHELAGGHEPVLLCWEVAPFHAHQPILIADAARTPEGKKPNWCHRRLVAHFFKEKLCVDGPELEI